MEDQPRPGGGAAGAGLLADLGLAELEDEVGQGAEPGAGAALRRVLPQVEAEGDEDLGDRLVEGAGLLAQGNGDHVLAEDPRRHRRLEGRAQDRHQTEAGAPVAHLPGVVHLLLHPRRLQGLGAQHHEDVVGAVDGGADLRVERVAGGELAAVDPEVDVVGLEGFAQPADHGVVGSRVRYEDAGRAHVGPSGSGPYHAQRLLNP